MEGHSVTPEPSAAILNDSNASANINTTSETNQIDGNEDGDREIARILFITTFPIILALETIGNVLTFIVMQRGSLKHSSTCFYMAMLALADTCKYKIHFLLNFYSKNITSCVRGFARTMISLNTLNSINNNQNIA